MQCDLWHTPLCKYCTVPAWSSTPYPTSLSISSRLRDMVASSSSGCILGQQRCSRNCENGTALQRSAGKKSPPLTLRSSCDWSAVAFRGLSPKRSVSCSLYHCLHVHVCMCVYMQWHREVWNFFLPLLFSLSLCAQPIPITMATSSLVEQAAGFHRNISAVPWCAMVWCTCFTVILRSALHWRELCSREVIGVVDNFWNIKTCGDDSHVSTYKSNILHMQGQAK